MLARLSSGGWPLASEEVNGGLGFSDVEANGTCAALGSLKACEWPLRTSTVSTLRVTLLGTGVKSKVWDPAEIAATNSLLSWCVAVWSQALTRPGGLNHLHILSTRVEETLLHVLARLGHPNFAEHLSATRHASEVGASLWGVCNPWYVPPPLR